MIKNITIITIAAIAIAAVIIATVALVGNQKQPEINLGGTGTRFPNGVAVGGSTSPTQGQLLINATTTHAGTVSYRVVGGIDYADTQISIAATSSVACSIPNPFGAATSTILSFMADITGTIAQDQNVYVSTSTATGAGSSTPALIAGRTITGGRLDTFFWSPQLVASTTQSAVRELFRMETQSDGTSPFILGPNERLTLRIATSTPGSQYYTGTCSSSHRKP